MWKQLVIVLTLFKGFIIIPVKLKRLEAVIMLKKKKKFFISKFKENAKLF